MLILAISLIAMFAPLQLLRPAGVGPWRGGAVSAHRRSGFPAVDQGVKVLACEQDFPYATVDAPVILREGNRDAAENARRFERADGPRRQAEIEGSVIEIQQARERRPDARGDARGPAAGADGADRTPSASGTT
jgi:hypothetical protein